MTREGRMLPVVRREVSSRALFRLDVAVSLRVAEDVGALLVELGAAGVEEVAAPGRGRKGAAAARLFVYGEERAHLVRLGARVQRSLSAARVSARIAVRAAPAAASIGETEWMRHLVPVRLSRTLTLVPTTAADVGAHRGRVVRLEPAMAFGFGEHPTTRLVAKALERHCRLRGARSVLDVGTGSGVLAIVAAVAGATRVLGIDVEGRAVDAARANARLNGVSGTCRFALTPATRVRARFDTVVANIDLSSHLALAPFLVRRLCPGGSLFLTGVLLEQVPELEARYYELGLWRLPRRKEKGWGLVSFRMPGASRGSRERGATARGTSRTTRSR